MLLDLGLQFVWVIPDQFPALEHVNVHLKVVAVGEGIWELNDNITELLDGMPPVLPSSVAFSSTFLEVCHDSQNLLIHDRIDIVAGINLSLKIVAFHAVDKTSNEVSRIFSFQGISK